MNVQWICVVSKFNDELNQRKKHLEDSVYSTINKKWDIYYLSLKLTIWLVLTLLSTLSIFGGLAPQTAKVSEQRLRYGWHLGKFLRSVFERGEILLATVPKHRFSVWWYRCLMFSCGERLKPCRRSSFQKPHLSGCFSKLLLRATYHSVMFSKIAVSCWRMGNSLVLWIAVASAKSPTRHLVIAVTVLLTF